MNDQKRRRCWEANAELLLGSLSSTDDDARAHERGVK